MRALPRVDVDVDAQGGRGVYHVTIDGVCVPNVTALDYTDVLSPFPRVTITLIANLYVGGHVSEEVADYAPWRDRPGVEQ